MFDNKRIKIMVHTLLTITPLQDAQENVATRATLPCIPLTQTLGPLPLASLDSNGWFVWEHKAVLLEGRLLQIAPVVNGVVMPPIHCFDVQSRQHAVMLSIVRDAQNPNLYYFRLDPAGATPVNPLNNSARLSNSAAQNQPTPALQVVSLRDKYLTTAQTTALEILGTIDTRPGRSTRLVFGNAVTIWAEQDALLFEWSAM